MKFQFDPAKATSNVKKHKVSFADAEGVFYDPLAIHREDPYSKDEERFVAVGLGNASQILVVVYTFREEEIRLVSARRATRREVKEYDNNSCGEISNTTYWQNLSSAVCDYCTPNMTNTSWSSLNNMSCLVNDTIFVEIEHGPRETAPAKCIQLH